MKFFSFAVAALATFASFASAAPLPIETGLEARGQAVSSTALKVPTTQEFINQHLIKAPRKNKSLFWTGQQAATDARRLRSVALDLAAKQGFDIVGEMLSDDALRLINGPKAPINKLSAAAANKFVEEASGAFAELSTGDVTIMMEGDPTTGPQPEAGSVFARIERPILEERAAHGTQAITGAFRIATNFKTTGVKVPFKL
ncbi:hypothetical protein HMN09_00851200 [Mycena chlorophos]|uniref:Uncharacterized protein n=1 Tax=Mycena chlorophos TaxID=658473 RepID=A0A8H6SS93_MYCCL|nr:hypothetical protein HMN09_00851200 [Mycena chlorophos]